MKHTIATFLVSLFFTATFGQQLISGDYEDGLRLCYDSATKKVTGYFEMGTGYDETTNRPRFSCIFYLEGVNNGKKFDVKTYFPADKANDQVNGTMELVSSKEVKILLSDEHGGCWNVQHFKNEPVDFTLDKSQPWIQARYVNAARAYFYSEKTDDKQMKTYIVKGDMVYVEKIDHDWAWCTYFGKKAFKGWVKMSELNGL
jgi:hypothetical protein